MLCAYHMAGNEDGSGVVGVTVTALCWCAGTPGWRDQHPPILAATRCSGEMALQMDNLTIFKSERYQLSFDLES